MSLSHFFFKSALWTACFVEQVSSDRVVVRLGLRSLGYTWGMITTGTDAASVGIPDVKNAAQGALAVGGSNCVWAKRLTESTIDDIVLTGCSLSLGSDYQVFAYAEDGNLLGDGCPIYLSFI